jgi:uncharacterized protein with HEPN domain
MSRDQQRLADYLTHILEAIERIDRYTEDMSEVPFLQNEMVQDAVIRNFEIIGEAGHNIEKHYPEFAAANPQLPLAFAYQMRNAVSHGLLQGGPGNCLADDPQRTAGAASADRGAS